MVEKKKTAVSHRKNNSKQTVEERVRTAVSYLRQENPGAAISIMEVCRLAEVSRSTLYEHHPSLLAEIRPVPRETNASLVAKKNRNGGSNETAILKKQVRQLAYLCVELRLALDAEKAKRPPPKAPSRRK